MIVYYLSLLSDTPNKGYWDYGILDDILYEFEFYEVSQLPEADSAIVVIPARSHYQVADRINAELKKIKKVILFLMGDEEAVFPIEKIKHEAIQIWVQNPKPKKHDQYNKLGCGYPPDIKNFTQYPDKIEDWFFAGQITHDRRRQMLEALKDVGNGSILPTKGFTQGFKQSDYYYKLSNAKVAPCPSGPETPDTFRLFEALELGCVPIADTQTSKENWSGFWQWLFEQDVPFPILEHYEQLKGYIEESAQKYPVLNNHCQAWWIRYKSLLRQKLINQLSEFGVENNNLISVVIPISPIPSNPDTKIIMETIQSIRHHLDCPIYLTFDGVRKEQIDMLPSYQEYTRSILWQLRQYKNVYPIIFYDHLHQVGLMREVIKLIQTPLLLYVEQDTPLVIDEVIEWDKINNFIMSGESNLVRLHFEGVIPKDHESLMIGKPDKGFLKTVQWSQRPHIASTAFYKRILETYFTENANCFIEDLIHGKLMEDWINYGMQGWNQWRVHIYHPKGHIKRSYNLDGRAGSKKYDDLQIW